MGFEINDGVDPLASEDVEKPTTPEEELEIKLITEKKKVYVIVNFVKMNLILINA